MKVFIGAWAAVIVTFAALASVPAYRKPWTIRTDAVSASPGILVSDPITQFVTPYVSFAAVRGAATPDLQITPQVRIVSGADPPTSMQDIDARTLLTGADAVAAHNGDGFSWRWRQAVQFDATSQIRIVVLGASGVSRSTVEVGYDGRTPAVRAVRFWWPWILSFAIAGVAMLAWPATWARQRNLSGTLRTGIAEAPLLCLLLIIAVGLRLALTYAGGQYFDGDETRYGAGAVNVFDLLSAGYPREALDAVLNAPDHPGFRIFAAGAALFHVASAALTRQPIAEMRVHSGEWLPAFVLSLSSAVSILLVYLIAERSGADRRESTIAAALMLCSQTMLMYSRGFFPYDVSMALLLGALWIGQKPGGVARSFVAGALAGLAVFVYEGHWLMGAAVGSVHALHRLRPVRGAVVHSVVFVLGSLSIWTAFLAAARFRQVPLLDALEAFSRNVTHGDFAEGWTLTWKSLLTIDGPVMMVSLAGCALVFVFAASRSSRSQRGLVWLAAAALIALGLGISSNVLHRFVVYDRLARQLVPFLCLASAAG
ncbi:MAG TPA: hypothetical protein VJP86_14380, partial [Vicinamibacterales bacterium]|nr:hypothetical protein [Vicinamibacterales bacterium]